MENEQLLHEKRDSIELKMNAKREYSWNIKIYYDETSEINIDIVDTLAGIDKALKERFA